ncbi:MAG: hypothetical protein WCP16_13105 [Pseudanabaena sp. ELA645]|jgi:hypothetical protein
MGDRWLLILIRGDRFLLRGDEGGCWCLVRGVRLVVERKGRSLTVDFDLGRSQIRMYVVL